MPDSRPNGAIPIDEGDLLAFVEGAALPAPRSAAVEAALARDPVLARRVHGMRSDRGVLHAIRDEGAPAGLVESVLAAVEPTLERRMLLDLEQGATPSRLPVSRVQPEGAVAGRIFGRSLIFRFATAAGLLLVVGGVTYYAASSSAPTPAPRSPVAQGPGPTEAPTDIALATNAGGTQPEATVSVPEDDAAAVRLAADPGPAAPDLGTVPDATAEAVMADASPVEHSELADADLLRLAAQRRLVLVVRTPNAQAAAGRLERASTRASSWQVSPQVPSAIETVLARTPRPPPIMERASTLPPETILASSEAWAREPMRRFIAPRPPPPPMVEAAQGDRLFVIESRLDEASLKSIRQALTLSGVEPDVRVLDEPLPGDGEVLHPSAVLWWTQPPAAWTRWASIPVVVEHSR